MDSWIFDMAIALVLSTIKTAVKNPAKKESLRRALLKVRDQINLLYASDEAIVNEQPQ
jgi:non-canonical (house-cleaning) NTP pyrophosphatase